MQLEPEPEAERGRGGPDRNLMRRLRDENAVLRRALFNAGPSHCPRVFVGECPRLPVYKVLSYDFVILVAVAPLDLPLLRREVFVE